MTAQVQEDVEKVSIQGCLKRLRSERPERQRLGGLGVKMAALLILTFALVLLPLFLFMLLFNSLYFWLRSQPSVSPKPYFNFDRHRVAHISLMDKLWCEYCEWANGTLQWTLAITNEIERRYCPIQNQCHPHCEKAKQWRNEFLDHGHQPVALKNYYEERYDTK